ncbi:MAG: TetR/AcrR family transcriptional regulator [Spirochaetales bacterium]|nr:TetR/AcrR family transcriptional regulator [Spirochaetales bacterium]
MHIVKDYDERRHEFLTTAMSLFMKQGYEQTSINHIIEAVGVSKGAFYHYFKSREDLLEQLAVFVAEQTLEGLQEVVENPSLSALEKMNQVFQKSNAMKARNREFILGLLKTFYHDNNIQLRNKINEKNLDLTAPLLGRIIRQGIEEGTMDTEYPEETGSFILRIGSELVTQIARFIPAAEKDPAVLEEVLRYLRVYTSSVERIIGVPGGSLQLLDPYIITVITGKENNHD